MISKAGGGQKTTYVSRLRRFFITRSILEVSESSTVPSWLRNVSHPFHSSSSWNIYLYIYINTLQTTDTKSVIYNSLVFKPFIEDFHPTSKASKKIPNTEFFGGHHREDLSFFCF